MQNKRVLCSLVILLMLVFVGCSSNPVTQQPVAEKSIDVQSTSETPSPVEPTPTIAPTPTAKPTEKTPEEINAALSTLEVTVDSAKKLVQDEELKMLYPDMLQVIVTNNGTSDTIKNLEIAYLAFDKGGYPIKIVHQYGLTDGSYEIRAVAEDVNLETGQKWGEESGYSVNEDSGKKIHYVLACAVSADLYNGEKWTNPYYEEWKEAFMDKPLPDFLK